jgi:hypothetical protein
MPSVRRVGSCSITGSPISSTVVVRIISRRAQCVHAGVWCHLIARLNKFEPIIGKFMKFHGEEILDSKWPIKKSHQID